MLKGTCFRVFIVLIIDMRLINYATALHQLLYQLHDQPKFIINCLLRIVRIWNPGT